MSRIDKAKSLRQAIAANILATKKLVRIDEISPEDLQEIKDLYPLWESGKAYSKDDLVRYNNDLYRVVKSHTSQGDWKPNTVDSLYSKVEPEGIIADFKKPLGAHDAYKKGDKVIFNDKIYESTIDNNVYSPSEYSQGWKEIE